MLAIYMISCKLYVRHRQQLVSSGQLDKSETELRAVRVFPYIQTLETVYFNNVAEL